MTKGRTREAGAVKISCARLDPNARNCHGYRKFVKRSILEDPSKVRGAAPRCSVAMCLLPGGGRRAEGARARTERSALCPPRPWQVDKAPLGKRQARGRLAACLALRIRAGAPCCSSQGRAARRALPLLAPKFASPLPLPQGYLVNDTIVIRYTIELVVSSGERRGPFSSREVSLTDEEEGDPRVAALGGSAHLCFGGATRVSGHTGTAARQGT